MSITVMDLAAEAAIACEEGRRLVVGRQVDKRADATERMPIAALPDAPPGELLGVELVELGDGEAVRVARLVVDPEAVLAWLMATGLVRATWGAEGGGVLELRPAAKTGKGAE